MCYVSSGKTYWGTTQSFRTTGSSTPRIYSFSPKMAVPGDNVTITGFNLDGATQVLFHGGQANVAATITKNTPNEVVFTVPSVAPRPGQLSVQTRGGISIDADFFTVGIDTIFDNFQTAPGSNGGTDLTIHFHATEPAPIAEFDCQLNSVIASTCSGGVVFYRGLAPGLYQVAITAHANGVQDSTPLLLHILLRPDSTLSVPTPVRTALAGPAGTFTAAASTSDCSRQFGGSWVPCDSPYTLTEPPEGAMATMSSPTDPIPLGTVLTSGFPGPDDTTTTNRSASFSFRSRDGGRFECSLDLAAWEPCRVPVFLDGLATGAHSFMVRAVDSAGHVDLYPATRSWTIE
jgi:hypothetical protein